MKRGVEDMIEDWLGESRGDDDEGSVCCCVNARSSDTGSREEAWIFLSSAGESLRFLWEDVVSVKASPPFREVRLGDEWVNGVRDLNERVQATQLMTLD